jgi:hypothetical protein
VRSISHRYLDPLDQIWLATAERIGLRVERTGDAYAATDGDRTLRLGVPAALDADDCLAQMIFHELCHWLVEGPDALRLPDWGLDNTSARDEAREHACLRVQAHLAGRHGLRGVLAPTTDYRAFYDRLPADPLGPGRDEDVIAARLAVRRADRTPWGPHLEAALAATAAVVARAAAFAPPGSLHAAMTSPPPPHPTGLPPSPRAAGEARTCGACSWRDTSGICRQTEGPSAVAAACAARAAARPTTRSRSSATTRPSPSCLSWWSIAAATSRSAARAIAAPRWAAAAAASRSPARCTRSARSRAASSSAAARTVSSPAAASACRSDRAPDAARPRGVAPPAADRLIGGA